MSNVNGLLKLIWLKKTFHPNKFFLICIVKSSCYQKQEHEKYKITLTLQQEQNHDNTEFVPIHP